MRSSSKIIVFVFFLSSSVSHSRKRDPISIPDSMATMGDSITAGAIAEYDINTARNPILVFALLRKIMLGFLSKSIAPLEARHLSWATGMDKKSRMTSHAKRLEFMSSHRPLHYFNAAKSGNESSDLLDQVESIQEWSNDNNQGRLPDYITMLIGANDLCAETPKQMRSAIEFENNIRETLYEIQTRNPHTKVLISTLPNLENLRSVAKDTHIANNPNMLTCEELWRKTLTCPTLTSLNDPRQRAKVAQRLLEYNAAINNVVGFNAGQYGREKVRVANTLYQAKFSSDHLSLDCFHPNTKGQELISELTWKASWWYHDWRDFHQKKYEDSIED